MKKFLNRIPVRGIGILAPILIGQVLFLLHVDILIILVVTIGFARILYTLEDLLIEAMDRQDKDKQDNKVQQVPAKK